MSSSKGSSLQQDSSHNESLQKTPKSKITASAPPSGVAALAVEALGELVQRLQLRRASRESQRPEPQATAHGARGAEQTGRPLHEAAADGHGQAQEREALPRLRSFVGGFSLGAETNS